MGKEEAQEWLRNIHLNNLWRIKFIESGKTYTGEIFAAAVNEDRAKEMIMAMVKRVGGTENDIRIVKIVLVGTVYLV